METVARNMVRAIHETLNGIEKCPKMYGGPEAIELQYRMLLMVLGAGYGLEPGAVRDIVEKVTAARVGGGCNSSLWSGCGCDEELIAALREIRAAVERLL